MNITVWPGWSKDIPPGASESDILMLLITDAILKHIAQDTLRYAQEHGDNSHSNLSDQDIYNYLCCIWAMGIVKMPQLRDYWKKPTDTGLYTNNYICNKMKRAKCVIGVV